MALSTKKQREAAKKKVNVIGGEISEKEKELYIKHVTCRTTQPVSEITIELDGEFVNLTWRYQDVPFQRIRRITGYLVGTLDRFNDGKRQSLHYQRSPLRSAARREHL